MSRWETIFLGYDSKDARQEGVPVYMAAERKGEGYGRGQSFCRMPCHTINNHDHEFARMAHVNIFKKQGENVAADLRQYHSLRKNGGISCA